MGPTAAKARARNPHEAGAMHSSPPLAGVASQYSRASGHATNGFEVPTLALLDGERVSRFKNVRARLLGGRATLRCACRSLAASTKPDSQRRCRFLSAYSGRDVLKHDRCIGLLLGQALSFAMKWKA
eukprot:3820751-Pleurochrysis_carterae.AAC.1